MKTILRPSGEDSFLKDAVRDLVIVVVGILGALWIEATWQDYQDRRTERQILAGLRTEFSASAAEMEDRLQTWQRMRQNRLDGHRHMGKPVNDENLAALEQAIRQSDTNNDGNSGGSVFFDPRHGQLTSVINSGQLGLVSNQALRAKIADWPAMVADHDWDEQAWIQHESNNLYSILRHHVSEWDDSRFADRYAELIQNFAFDNGLRGSVGLLSLMINEGNDILEATREIIGLIDRELGTTQ
jgi:hypothetical protein